MSDLLLDDETREIIEKARQRRAMLAKMKRAKRNSDENTNPQQVPAKEHLEEVSPNKRPCLKEIESNVLTDNITNAAKLVPMMDKMANEDNELLPKTPNGRRKRFADLADKVNQWEDESNIHVNFAKSNPKQDNNKSIRVENTTPKITSPCRTNNIEKIEDKRIVENVYNKIDSDNNKKMILNDNNNIINKQDVTKRCGMNNKTTVVTKRNIETIQINNNNGFNTIDDNKQIITNNIALNKTTTTHNIPATNAQNTATNTYNKTTTTHNISTTTTYNTSTTTTPRGDTTTGHKKSFEPTKMTVHERLNIWKNKDEAAKQDAPSPQPIVTKTAKRRSNERKFSPYQSGVNNKLKTDWLNKVQTPPPGGPREWPNRPNIQTVTSKLQQKLLQQVQSTEKAEIIRKNRDTELALIGCQWESYNVNDDIDNVGRGDKGGDDVRKDDEGGVKSTKKEQAREKMRSEFEKKMKEAGLCDENDAKTPTKSTQPVYKTPTKSPQSNTPTKVSTITINIKNNPTATPANTPTKLETTSPTPSKRTNNNTTPNKTPSRKATFNKKTPNPKLRSIYQLVAGDNADKLNDDDGDDPRPTNPIPKPPRMISNDKVIDDDDENNNNGDDEREDDDEEEEEDGSVNEETSGSCSDDEEDDEDDVDVSDILDEDVDEKENDDVKNDNLDVLMKPNDSPDVDVKHDVSEQPKSPTNQVTLRNKKRKSRDGHGYISLAEYRQLQRPQSQPNPPKQPQPQKRFQQQQSQQETPPAVVMRKKNKLYPDLSDELPVSMSNNKYNIRELEKLVESEMRVIEQTSAALKQCCRDDHPLFAGSPETVECHRLLLVSCKRREAYMMEIQRLRAGEGRLCGNGEGRLSISDIKLPIKNEYLAKMGSSNDISEHHFVVMFRHGSQITFTQMVSTSQLSGQSRRRRGGDALEFPNLINISNVAHDFRVDVEIYSLSVTKEHNDQDHESSRKKKGLSKLLTPRSNKKPTTSAAVRTTNFTHTASLAITRGSLDYNVFPLDRVPKSSPIQHCIHMDLSCLMKPSICKQDFLTIFEDVGGLGAWHRRWFELREGVLRFWRYPDDQANKEPLGRIDLRECTGDVGVVSRDACARPFTLQVPVQRQLAEGDRNTLIQTKQHNSLLIKYWLSADTKEDREEWMKALNDTLHVLKTWK